MPHIVTCADCGAAHWEDTTCFECGPSPVERAYGLLWMVLGDDPKVHEARKILLSQIDKEGQRRGIQSAVAKYPHPPIETILHKLP